MPQFFLGGVFTAVRERFTDTFVRNDRSDLGRASDGSLWTTIREGLSIGGTKAVATNPLSYPMSTIDMPSSNVTIDLLGVSQGAGAAIWVQSSDDWYSVTIDQTPRNVPETTELVSANYSYGAAFNSSTGTEFAPFYTATFNNAYNQPGSWTTTVTNNATGYRNTTGNYSYTAWNTFFFKYSSTSFSKWVYFLFNAGGQPVYGWNSTTTWGWARSGNSYTANASYTYRTSFTFKVVTESTYNYTVFYPATFAGNVFAGNYSYQVTIPGYNYQAFAPYTYSVIVPANTVYDQRVSLRQSIEGNLQLLTSWLVSSSEVIRSLKVRLIGNSLATRVYSDPNQVSQIGNELLYTATGAEISTKFGLIISPSSYGQGTTAASSISISI